MKLRGTMVAVCLLAALSAPAAARDQEPGSVLVYPSVRGVGGLTTLVSVTNTSGAVTIGLRFSYVNMLPGVDGFTHADCVIDERFEVLTPNDTFSAVVPCHNPVFPFDGYLVVTAIDLAALQPVAHDFLIGSELAVFGATVRHQLNAISFRSPLAAGAATDLDGDGELDFDGLEYDTCGEELFLDSFIASLGVNLSLIGLTGGTPFTTTVAFTVFNDNEFPLQAQRNFRCWFDQPLDVISPAFSAAMLLGTPHDPSELDVDCDRVGDVETGWVRIRGVVAATPLQAIPGPALLGAVTTSAGFERGRLLWRTGDNPRGDFIGLLPFHPEFP